MATQANVVGRGTRAPDFTLSDAHGKRHRLEDLRGSRGTLVAFICNHCPYVIHIREALARFAADYADRGIAVVGINPNDPQAYPEERAERIAELEPALGFPYLIDIGQAVARDYQAACTPDLYLFDADLRLHYHGQFDDTRPRSGVAATGADLRSAADTLLSGAALPFEPKPAMGCSIKWAPGHEPQWTR